MLSISIVIYILEPRILKELLSSLTNAINELPQQWRCVPISVIDNGNQHDDITCILSDYKYLLPDIKYIPTKSNIGYGQAHNLAINECNSKYHLILNPDVIISSGALKSGLEYLEENNFISVVAPKVSNEKVEEQHLCKRYPSLVDLVIRGLPLPIFQKIFSKRLARYESRDITVNNQPVSVELVSGCFMLCRTEHLKKCNGFDKRYFLYFEDFALSVEMAKLGLIYYLPSMKIIHYGGNTSRKGFRHILMFISSAVKFYNCYGWKFY